MYATIREPGAWYRSVWSYARSARYGNKGRRWLSYWGDGCQEDFAAALRAWTAHGGLPYLKPEEMLNPDPHSDAPTLYQAAVRHYYAGGVDGWVRLEHQAEDLAELLDVYAHQIARLGIRNVTPGVERGELTDHADRLESDRVFWGNLLTAPDGVL